MSSRVSKLLSAAALAGLATTANAQLSPNQANVAAAITTPVGTPTAATVAVQTSLAGVPTSALPAAYSQFTPGSYSLLGDLSMQTADFQESVIRRYLRDFRAGGTGVQGVAGQAAPGERKYGSFLVANGQTGHFDANGDRSRTDYGSQNVIGGMDLRFGEKSLIGITGGYSNVDARLDPGSRNSRIGNWFGGGYGTLGVGPLYVDLFGTYGEGKYDLRRSVNFGGNTVTPTDLNYSANTRSRIIVGGATTGLSFNEFGFEFEPFVGGRYTNVRINGFTDGTDIGALSVGREKYESVLGTAGLRIGAAIPLGDGVSLRPEVRGEYRHEFEHYGSRGFDVGFGGGTGGLSTVAFSPTPLARDYAKAGAGLTLSSAHSPFSIVLDYDGTFARDRTINGLTGGFRLTF
ncbi:autotransporter outer membrane beta-barrel domain-containing protein [Glacieibacterium megasporae]|uniref:autotransporter outer membrane beta-barrel domain-containing protein n=1 Tax=Glacieibacterium megasporae TaxID=2835787 RepID=UPI001C1E44D9|nr:autotransporter outer membrane beta-barrel domain-containing protein [Polymorphobacter megasporae]UAJ09564.1 autotransporter outer membrane beta-barrel domain-containing protein [Polymorphobacter megasporae]